MSKDEWTIEDVAGLLKAGQSKLKKCCVLIGAGVSRSAGIGIGSEFIELIRENHATAYRRAQRKAAGANPTYAECMYEVSEADRAALVREQIEAAKINWAHIGLARLEAAQCIDRILTTNFDPLASRACALFNRFPAVYDLAALRDSDASSEHARYVPAFVSGSAIYHLHGQHTGFLLLNTGELLETQAERIEPVLSDAVNGRVVIVCGYSGENDPLVQRLRQTNFPHGLIWVRHDDLGPCEAVTRMLERFPDAHIVRNIAADRFFPELANALGLPQPAFLTQPFHHMQEVLNTVRPFSDIGAAGVDLLLQARALLTSAAEKSRSESPDQEAIADLVAQERYQEVIDRFGEDVAARSDEEKNLVAWAWVMLGNEQQNQAEKMSGPEADELFAQAIVNFAAALGTKPRMYEALYNWGNALGNQARTKSGDEADTLFAAAIEKYIAALEIAPDMHEALYNWGTTLLDQAKRKSGVEANELLGTAGDKFAAALAIKPDKWEALGNWAAALTIQAKATSGAEADALFSEAEQKLRQAREISPTAETYNLACLVALRGQAKEAAEWLRQGYNEGQLPNCAHINADSDFDGIRDHPDFIQALKDIGC